MKSVLRWCVVPLLAGTLMAPAAAKPKPKKAAPARPAGGYSARHPVLEKCAGRATATDRAT